MDRKRQKLSLEKSEVHTRCPEEEVTVLKQKVMNLEAELKLKNEEKDHLVQRITSLEEEVARKEAQIELKSEEQKHLVERVTLLEQVVAEKENQLKLKDEKQTHLMKRITSLEEQLKYKDTQLLLVKEPFSALPNELVVEIFKHLTQNQLGKMARVCRNWNELTKSPVLWLKVAVQLHYSHASQNAVVKSLINRLPICVTSIEIDFGESGTWIQPLDFHEFCATLQQKCPGLKTLILYFSELSNTHPSVIHLCSQFIPSVTTLVLRWPEFLDSPRLVRMCITSRIEILDLTGADMRHFSGRIFSKMTNLKRLCLKDAPMMDGWYEGDISFLNGVEVLHLGNTYASSSEFQAVKNHGQNLRELYMCMGFKYIYDDDSSAFPKLETICLNYCNEVTCEGVVSLVKSCPTLQNIYVDERVVSSYAEHPFISANPCKLGIVKTVDCEKHDKIY